MKKQSYSSSVPLKPETAIKNMPISSSSSGGSTLSSFPDSSTENAGRAGFNLQEMAVDVDGNLPEQEPMKIPQKEFDIDEIKDLMISLGDELDAQEEDVLANFADFMLVKIAEIEQLPSKKFNQFLVDRNATMSKEAADGEIISLVMKYSQSILDEIEKGKDKEAAKIVALSNVMGQGKTIKTAQNILMVNDPKYVATQLAAMIQIMISRLKPQSRMKGYRSIRTKLNVLNPSGMSQKKSPGGAVIGTSLNLTKNLLNGRDPLFIKLVIQELMRII